MLRFLFFIFVLNSLSGCLSPGKKKYELDYLAEQYVRLGLEIGQYDPKFVDAYYGPDSLKPQTPLTDTIFPKEEFLNKVKSLREKVVFIQDTEDDKEIKNRAGWISDQLRAFEGRIRVFAKEKSTFDEESKELFDAIAPRYEEKHFIAIIHELDSILPGEGSVETRFQKLADKFTIPKDKIDTLFKTAIEESRRVTKEYYSLPEKESFSLEYVTGKSWSGYNWYKGNYTSLIQINTDVPITIDRVIDVGSHESYPGHHVYNMLLEKNLYHDKNRVEISLYPLFSPQSLIAEGSANYGIDMVFPGNRKASYAGEVLLPLAGLDTTDITLYMMAIDKKRELNYVRNEVGRLYLAGKMSKEQAIEWLMKYGLFSEASAEKSLKFIEDLRSYVINYNYGLNLIGVYIEKDSEDEGNGKARWDKFEKLLSNQIRIRDIK